ncbi:hypothetical protein R1sor_014996 [Riccia sorocarpa]|uniref:DUF7869 domain-containing protein n=1 Tax=Riccia sorocarpa TaxID=122646 RepID=A0ABD3HDL4_9MARC
MATSSRGDKGKAPMVEQEDIGTEEGELLDVHPPLPEPVGRSGSDRKRKNPAREEEELAIVRFLEEKEKPDARPWETSISAMSQRLARFLKEVPKNWDKHFDLWLKSREFESWTQDAILPPTLYLQLDNTVRENKNNILFAYLAMLLEKKVFTKIKLGFLLVGHTHDFVDQMFSRFSQALRRENAFTMSRLRSVIENSYDPKHVTTILTQTWNFKHFIETEPKLFRTLNDIIQNQQYKFKVASALEVRVWCKQFSTDNTWEPPVGVRNILHIDGSRAILASEQVPLKSYAEIKRQTRRVQNIGPLVGRQDGEAIRHVQTIRQDIQTHCYPFFDDEQKDWWNHWFMLQEEIGRNISNNRRGRLVGDMCWFWPVPPERDEHAVDEPVAVTILRSLGDGYSGRGGPSTLDLDDLHQNPCGKINFTTHCQDQFLKDNWETWFKTAIGGRKDGSQTEVRKNFLFFVDLEKHGLRVDWTTVDKSRNISEILVAERHAARVELWKRRTVFRGSLLYHDEPTLRTDERVPRKPRAKKTSPAGSTPAEDETSPATKKPAKRKLNLDPPRSLSPSPEALERNQPHRNGKKKVEEGVAADMDRKGKRKVDEQPSTVPTKKNKREDEDSNKSNHAKGEVVQYTHFAAQGNSEREKMRWGYIDKFINETVRIRFKSAKGS